MLIVSTSALVHAPPLQSNTTFSVKKTKKAWLLSYAFFAWLVANFVYADSLCQLEQTQLKQLPTATVSRIIDGDTVLLKDGRRVRLIGIDAPELGEPLADEASDALRKLVMAKTVYLQQGPQASDKYQRVLANLVLVDGQNVEALLLQQGLGFLVAIPPNLDWLDCHLAMAEEAKMAKRGVWLHYRAKQSAALTLADTGFQRLHGRLLSMDKRDAIWWLQFEGPIVARITPAQQAYFDWRQLKQMVGKDVLVSGWVVDRSQQRQMKKYSPLMLLLTHPAHIEVLSRPVNAAKHVQ